VNDVPYLLRSGASWALCVLLCGACGCGDPAPKSVETAPSLNTLRTFSTAYTQATIGLNRAPRNADEIKSYLSKLSEGKDPKEFLKSPIDGAPFVIAWGVDPRSLKGTEDGKFPIWAHEANPHSGKRWVVQSRHVIEMSEDDFRNATFAPGLKKP
jgi:hypothetical protein